MDINQPSRAIAYVLVLAGCFAVLFVLENVFGLHYAPNEHRLNQKSKVGEQEVYTQVEPVETKKLDNKARSANAEDETLKGEDKEEANPTKEDFFGSLMKDYQSNILGNLNEGKARTDIVIRYYRHAPDGNSAYALEKLGFYIHERPVDPRYADFQSNAIYYGDSVRLEDIQIVGYTLLNEGLPIKVIKPSKFSDSWKSRSIEIGTDTALVGNQTLSIEALMSLTK